MLVTRGRASLFAVAYSALICSGLVYPVKGSSLAFLKFSNRRIINIILFGE